MQRHLLLTSVVTDYSCRPPLPPQPHPCVLDLTNCPHLCFEGQTMGRRHLEYLQLFEKEMTMNYLRQRKDEEMSGIEMTVNKLQKRSEFVFNFVMTRGWGGLPKQTDT